MTIGLGEQEDGQKEFLGLFLDFLRGPFVMLSACLDESGTHENAPAMCVAGILYERDAVKLLNRAWKKELAGANIQCFHTADAAHLYGEFKDKTHEFAGQLYQRLIAILNKHACGTAVACYVPRGAFDVFKAFDWGYSSYTVCAYFCMQMMLALADRLGHKRQVSFFIESGHEKMGELDALIKQQRRAGWKRVEHFAFVGKDSIRALQTADILVYEVAKRLKDMSVTPEKAPERHLRKSLEAIIGKGERNHPIMVLNEGSLLQFRQSLF